jgi:hypothetical protein
MVLAAISLLFLLKLGQVILNASSAKRWLVGISEDKLFAVCVTNYRAGKGRFEAGKLISSHKIYKPDRDCV